MSLLFTPHAVGPLTVSNRIVVAPMCQYSAVDGVVQPWHRQHLGRLALSGAGLVIVEATGVLPEGRITPGDTGLWNAAQEAAFRDLLAEVRSYAKTPIGIQLGHAGRKASTHAPWIDRGRPLAESEGAWTTVAPSPVPFKDDWHVPEALDEAGMDRVVEGFVAAARRAERAGFDLVELHAAHGYLLSEFLSPVANRRTDAYGGSLENRMRFPLSVARALREAWPRDRALGARFNGSDWVEGGLTTVDAVAFGRALAALGYDYLHVSSGGNAAEAKIPGREPGYQVPLAEAVKVAVPDITVIAVGMIFEARQAEAVVADGRADMIAIARAVLDDPNWGHHAAVALGAEEALPNQYAMASKAIWAGYGRAA